jgi:hypothetical protein
LIVWATNGLVVSWRDILKAMRPPFLSAAVATAVGVAAAPLLGKIHLPLPRLLLEGGVVLASYLGVLLSDAEQRRFYFDLLGDLLRSSRVQSVRIEATPAVERPAI